MHTLSAKKYIWLLCIYFNYYKNVLLFFCNVFKNEQKEHKFWRQKNLKSDCYKNKKVFQIDDIDVNKILVSKKEPYGTKNALKYFIGDNDNDVIRLLCLRLSQMTDYAKRFNENATVSFRAKHLLKNYNKIWEKFGKLLRIDFESKPVYGDDDKYIKIKIKVYGSSMITNFHNKNDNRKIIIQVFINNNARFCY